MKRGQVTSMHSAAQRMRRRVLQEVRSRILALEATRVYKRQDDSVTAIEGHLSALRSLRDAVERFR